MILWEGGGIAKLLTEVEEKKWERFQAGLGRGREFSS